jgi:Tol biopolymer transport system component/predicted Ser/Thr protein kinase
VTLPAGARVGPYEVVSLLGTGGMGEVYRARDTRLKREIALKILPQAVATDPDRLARFQREAELLAALNHRNIAHVHGLEESNGTRALVMEFVEGESLATRIGRGPLSLDEALPIARQIADALESAHERGIVHRDLKPANIMVMADGQVKVLDFGLAKAMGPAGAGVYGAEGGSGFSPADSPTMTSPVMTAAGMILGTAAYMSPEQARGKAVDKRADIWAFGVIVFEMLTGKPLFAADSVADTFAAIVSRTPDWSQLPQEVQPLVQAALEPDPRRRLRDIGDAFRLVGRASPQTDPRPPRRVAALIGMGAVTLLAGVLGIAGWIRRTPAPALSALRLQMTLPAGGSPDLGLSLSPDGRRLAVVVVNADGGRSAWVRELDALEARPVAGAEDLDTNPLFWSPDSRWLGFTSRGVLQKADVVAGGKPVRVFNGGQIGADWNAEGTIVFGTNPGRGVGGSIFRVSAAGGDPVQLTAVDVGRGEYAHHHPTFLPDGRHFLYLRAARPEDRSGIYMGSIDAAPDRQSTQRLLATTFGPVFFVPANDDPTGFLFFFREGSLMAQRFDPASFALSGEPQQVATPVGSFIDRALYWVSRNRTIVYAAAAPVLAVQLTWVDRQDHVLRTVGAPGLYAATVRSPDGARVATVRVDIASPSEKRELWLWDLERDAHTLFWFKSPLRSSPVWSPDGTRLLFAVVDEGPQLYERAINGGQEGRVVFRGKRGEPLTPTSWSPDGRFVLFTRLDQTTGSDIWALTRSDGTAAPLIQSLAPESDAQFSPDGRWIAYAVSEGGRQEVYVTAVLSSSPKLAVGGGPWRVSNGGGQAPRWRADGREIFYVGPRSMMAVPVSTESGFAAAAPIALPGAGANVAAGRFGFIDASRDGRELLLARPVTDTAPRAPLNVLINWAPDVSR